MKKHKSVVAILLAVMMIFTMMPMMAFADAPGPVKAKAKFNSDYSEVTVPAYKDESGSDAVEVPQKTYKTIRIYDGGVITATIDPKEANNVSWDLPTGIVAQYYDLSAAELADTADKNLKAEYAFGTFDPAKLKKIKLNVPSYVANAKEAVTIGDETFDKAEVEYISFTAFKTATKWDGKVTGVSKEEGFDPTARTEQNLTVGFDGEYASTPTEDDIAILGNIPEKAVKVNAATPDPAYDAHYTWDGNEAGTVRVKNSDKVYTYYDGAAHTFAASEVSGWTVAYSTYDAKTGKWNPATAISLSDVQDKDLYVKASWTKAGDQNPTQEPTFHVNLVPAGVALVGFVPGEDEFYSVPGTQYDAASYIGAYPYVYREDGYSKDADERAAQKFQDAALAKAVEANKTELVAYFNELNDVNAAVYKYNPNAVLLSITAKDLTSKEEQAVKDKYEALRAKFTAIGVGKDKAVVALNGVDLTDYEIEFTAAPAKKVIKTKKAKSTKKVTINVKAECKNGTLVKYKLINAPKKNITINANTGKITVKKGLAAGTYKFKVKAYIPSSRVLPVGADLDDRDALSEVQTIKVVVKKTKKK